MCARCETMPAQPFARQKHGRLKLWEFQDNAHCPVIGTCLTQQDLVRIAKSLRLVFDASARDYDVHGYFVKAATLDCPEARAVTKLLDERYAGALRQVKRVACPNQLSDLWNAMKADGRIAAGFWAFMTSSHVPLDLRGHIFGEVHMLSHLMGASCRAQTARTASLRYEIDEMTRRRDRTEAGLHAALSERDETILRLRGEIETLRKALVARTATDHDAGRKTPRADGKVQRALDIARGRARAAEDEVGRLKAKLNSKPQSARRPVETFSAARDAGEPGSSGPIRVGSRLDGRSFLYVGGRNGQRPHLKKVAETFGAALHHHDGGLEDAIGRLDDVLPSVDCVFCPVDCVSHDACLRAKQGCKKLGKTFVPLRSASKACLRHALISLIDEAPGKA